MNIDRAPVATINYLWQKVPVNIRVTFLSAFFIGILTHVFMLTNILPNHDELVLLVGNPDSTEAGRWFLRFPAAISGIFSMPLVNGLLSVTWLSFAACFVVSSVKINKRVYCAFAAGLMVTFPSVAATLTYMQVADAHFFALMLACFAAYLAERYKYGYIAAVVPVVLSLGIYQSFFGVTAGLMIIALLRDVLENNAAPGKTLLKGLRYVGVLCAGMIINLLVVRLTIPPSGLSHYQNMDQLGRLSLSELPYAVFRAYRSVAAYFLIDTRNVHFSFMPAVFIISALLCVFLLALWCVRKRLHKEPSRMALLIVLLILLPLGCNIVYVMGAYWVHDLMIYGIVLIPVLMLMIIDLYSDDDFSQMINEEPSSAKAAVLSCWVLTVSVALCIFNYWISSNQAYIKMTYAYEQTYAQSLLLVSRIQAVDGYSRDTEIVLVGTPRLENGIPELEDVTLTGAVGTELFGDWSYPFFLSRYLNFTQEVFFLRDGIVSEPEIAAVVSEMPVFPDSGSVLFIRDKIYVKLSYPSPGE